MTTLKTGLRAIAQLELQAVNVKQVRSVTNGQITNKTYLMQLSVAVEKN